MAAYMSKSTEGGSTPQPGGALSVSAYFKGLQVQDENTCCVVLMRSLLHQASSCLRPAS